MKYEISPFTLMLVDETLFVHENYNKDPEYADKLRRDLINYIAKLESTMRWKSPNDPPNDNRQVIVKVKDNSGVISFDVVEYNKNLKCFVNPYSFIKSVNREVIGWRDVE